MRMLATEELSIMNRYGIKAILLDFDGTLLQNDQVFISLKNIEAIKRCVDSGIIIIPSTGRNADMFPPQIDEIKDIRYWVTSNGARVIDRLNDEIIYQFTFTPDESSTIMKLFEGEGIYCEIAAEGKIFLEADVASHVYDFKVPPHHVWYVGAKRPIAQANLAEFFSKNGYGIEKLNFYDIKPDRFMSLKKQIEGLGFARIFGSKAPDIQCFPSRLDRAQALEVLFERLGISFADVMSIGDSELDSDLLRKSKLGVAVGNASDEVKKISDYVTASNQDNGVALAIEKFILD